MMVVTCHVFILSEQGCDDNWRFGFYWMCRIHRLHETSVEKRKGRDSFERQRRTDFGQEEVVLGLI